MSLISVRPDSDAPLSVLHLIERVQVYKSSTVVTFINGTKVCSCSENCETAKSFTDPLGGVIPDLRGYDNYMSFGVTR